MASLFYPTDDPFHDELLGYYRQREWRLIVGIARGGISLSSALDATQALRLMEIDGEFWNRKLSYKAFPPDPEINFKRADRAYVISGIDDKKLIAMVKAVIVLPEALDRTKTLLRAIPEIEIRSNCT